jgi:hypothetical protein
VQLHLREGNWATSGKLEFVISAIHRAHGLEGEDKP